MGPSAGRVQTGNIPVLSPMSVSSGDGFGGLAIAKTIVRSGAFSRRDDAADLASVFEARGDDFTVDDFTVLETASDRPVLAGPFRGAPPKSTAPRAFVMRGAGSASRVRLHARACICDTVSVSFGHTHINPSSKAASPSLPRSSGRRRRS